MVLTWQSGTPALVLHNKTCSTVRGMYNRSSPRKSTGSLVNQDTQFVLERTSCAHTTWNGALIRFPPAVRTVGRIAVVSRFRRGGDGFGFLLRNARARGGDVENGGGVDEDGVAAGERSPGSAAGKAEVEQGAEEAEDVLSAVGREHSVGVTT